jgi:hypothetical protein
VQHVEATGLQCMMTLPATCRCRRAANTRLRLLGPASSVKVLAGAHGLSGSLWHDCDDGDQHQMRGWHWRNPMGLICALLMVCVCLSLCARARACVRFDSMLVLLLWGIAVQRASDKSCLLLAVLPAVQASAVQACCCMMLLECMCLLAPSSSPTALRCPL